MNQIVLRDKSCLSTGLVTRTILILISFFIFSDISSAQDQDNESNEIIWKVDIKGNDTFANMFLFNIIAADQPSFFQRLFGKTEKFELIETELQRDAIRIERYYQRRGFINVAVNYSIEDLGKERKKKVIFEVQEGAPIRIRSLDLVIDAEETDKSHIVNSPSYQRALKEHIFQEGNRYQVIRIPDVEGRFVDVIQNLGFAYAEVSVEADVDSAALTTDIIIRNTPGPKTSIDEFIVEADLSVPERILTRETGINTGSLYSNKDVQEAQRQIFNHHLFRFAIISIPEQPRDSSLTMLIRAREYMPRSVEASIGAGREEIIRGQLSWQHRNITGTGHRFSASSRGSFIEQRLNADYLIPYVFNTKSSYVTSLFGQRRFEPSFELRRVGISNSLIYQPRRNLTGSFSYEFSINKELSRKDRRTALPDTVLNFDVSSLSFSGFYSEGFSREQRGWVVQPSFEISGTFGESTFRFQKISLDVRRFTELTSSTVLATRLNGGTIFFAANDSLPSTIRFFTGGTNSVRGWSRQDLGPKVATFNDDDTFDKFIPIGGRILFNFNLELRQEFNSFIDGFGVAGFLDGGQVWRNFERFNERSVQFGAGGGFRYKSPIGPVRIDLGYKLNPTDDDLDIFEGEDFGNIWNKINIHFSIGQAF